MLNAERPKNLTSPVDYRHGSVHIRAEVLDREAGGRRADDLDAVLHANKGLKAGYGCTGTQVYKEKGVYEQDVKMTDFWQNDYIVWGEGIKEMHLVMKDDSGGQGHAQKRPDPEKFFPTKMRITMIQVAKGSTYDPKLVPNLPRRSEPGLPRNSSAPESLCRRQVVALRDFARHAALLPTQAQEGRDIQEQE